MTPIFKLGGLKVFHKTIQMQTEVIYSNWNAACHKAMASLVPSVVVICADRKKQTKKLKCIQIFVIITLKRLS